MIVQDIDYYAALQNEAVKRGWRFYQNLTLDYHLVANRDCINEQIDEFLLNYPELQRLYRQVIAEPSEMDKYRRIKRALAYKD